MADTNFSSLLSQEKNVWSRSIWKVARQNSFVLQMSGTGINAAIQRITELTKTERGTKATVTLVPDAREEGTVGDAELEGHEEALVAFDQVIEIDQLRHGVRSEGRMAEQSTIVKFRETARDVLGFWLADAVDQLAMLTLSGVDYRIKPDGKLRDGYTHNGTAYSRNTTTAPTNYSFADLAFAGDVTAPSANRHFRWDGTNKKLVAGDTTAITAADKISYAALVRLKSMASNRRIKSLRAGGQKLYHILMHPETLADLKLDPDFLANIRNAGVRGNSNPLFSGAIVTVDGLVLHEHPYSFTTLEATTGTVTNAGWPGYQWGADADIPGNRVLLLGAQALATADIDIPLYEEDQFDYKNKPGISIGKIFGFLKPVFKGSKDAYDTAEDFGVMAMDVAIG